MSDTMQGRRLPDAHSDLPAMEPGDYVFDYDGGNWFIVTPNGMGARLNPNHTLTCEADGTLTVAPSILVTNDWESKGRTWHGYLEHGVWSEA